MKIIVDSDFRLATDTAESYRVTLATPIKNPKVIILKAATLGKSIYPIQTGYNDLLNFTSTGAKSVTIPAQNYSGAQLAAELQALIRTATTNAFQDVTYNVQLNKLIIGETNGTAFTITADTTSPHTLFTLGLTAGQVANNNTFNATNMLDLSYPRYVNLDIEFGGNSSNNTVSQATKHSYIVPLGKVDFKEIAYFTEGNGFKQLDLVNNQTFDFVKVSVTQPDNDSTKIGFLNGIHHELIFEIIG